MSWIANKNWENGKSYLSIEELENEYVHVLYKICNILFSKEYFEDTIVFARSVLDFANDHEYITWKQVKAIMNIKTTEERKVLYGYKSSNNYVYRQSGTTDRDHDRMTKMLFGDDTRAEELDGYTKCYRDDGSRYFAMPTGDERLSDYI